MSERRSNFSERGTYIRTDVPVRIVEWNGRFIGTTHTLKVNLHAIIEFLLSLDVFLATVA